MPGLGPRSLSHPSLSGAAGMKIRRSPSIKSYGSKERYGGSYSGQQPGANGCRSRLAGAGFYLVVFAAGCLMTTLLLNLAPQRLDSGARVLKPGEVHATRRALYTSGTGGLTGAWDASRTPTHAHVTLRHRSGSSSSSSSSLPPDIHGAVASGGGSSGASPTGDGSSGSAKGAAGAAPGAAAAAAAGGGASPDEPPDFDWKAYLLRYPDLRSGNIRTKQAALWHYSQKGKREHRSYARVPILLRYTACQGLFNQMYAHLNALVLADYLGADVMLPPSVYRESFSKYFSMDLKKNEVKWTPADTGALLDVEAIQAHYAAKGVRVHRTAPYESFPDCMHPQDAFPRYLMPDVKPEQMVRLGDTYLQSMHIWYIWDRAAEKILAKHRELVAAGHPANTTVVLDLPCPFLSIMTLTCMEAAQEAATALKFNKTLVGMARTIINGMRAAGVQRYNGAHLRLEKDAVDWARILGGFKKYLAEYARSFGAAGFSRRKDLYIASGLLSYNASKEMTDMLAFLEPHARSVQYKELYLPAELLHTLNPEQEALVDFLVLANSDNFVGLGSSTFSVYLREYRVLLGHARLADVFVDTSKIGTDALFERCTHFAPLDTTAVGAWHKPATR